MRVFTRLGATLGAAMTVFSAAQPARAQNVVVFAAASLTNALDQVTRVFEQQGGARVKISYAASSALLKGGRLAMADADSVPAGRYGKAALEELGIWSSVRGAVAPAESVRAALLLVSRREAPLGVVYATDAKADPRVKIVGVFPDDTHPPIIYPAALTASSKNSSAARLLDFLASPAAKPISRRKALLCSRVPEALRGGLTPPSAIMRRADGRCERR